MLRSVEDRFEDTGAESLRPSIAAHSEGSSAFRQQEQSATMTLAEHSLASGVTEPISAQQQAQFAQAIDAVTQPTSNLVQEDMSYDDLLLRNHGDDTLQPAQLKEDTEAMLAGLHTNTYSNIGSSTATIGPDVGDTLWGRMKYAYMTVLNNFKLDALSILTEAQQKDQKARQKAYVQYGLQQLVTLLAVILVGLFALWATWRGLLQFAAALKQPAFHLSWLGVAVICIVASQTPRNNQALRLLSDGSLFATYGQAKRFLNIVTYTSVGLFFAGVFYVGLA